MGITLFGLLTLPICALYALSPDRLLQLVVLGSTFEAAAVLTFGGFGLQPALLPTALFSAYVMLQLLLGARHPGTRMVLWIMTPYVVVALWALVSSFLLPRLFANQIYVWPQKILPPFLPVPLEPNASNINQDIYILADCTVLVLTALHATRGRFDMLRLLRAYWISGYVAVAIAVWQLASSLAGLPFPSDILSSNPGYAQLTNQALGGVPRINGSFTEPAALAGYLCGIIGASGWTILNGHATRIVKLLLPAALLGLLISTSTTGYAVLVIMIVALPCYALATRSHQLLSRLILAGVLSVMIGTVVVLTLVTLVPAVERNAQLVFASTLDKQQSSSYQDRTSTDFDSLAVVLPTWGLGVGWGSNRSSSLLPGLLAGLGLYGTAGLGWFGLRVTRLVRRARPVADRSMARVIDASTGSVVATLAAGLLSGPAITSVLFYILLALLVAASVRTLVIPTATDKPQAGASVADYGVWASPTWPSRQNKAVVVRSPLQ